LDSKIEEKIVKSLLFLMALTAVLSVILIGFFVFKEGTPVFYKYGLRSVLLGAEWHPLKQIYGILPMIIGTIFVTFVAILVGTPTGIAAAIFLAEISPKGLQRIIRPAVELLAGIPSVIYGLFGMVAVRGIIADIERGFLHDYLPANYQVGYSVLAGGIVLGIMILPTIINISEDAIKAVPKEYKEGSLAMGATHWQTIYKVLVPAAKSGIIASIVLGTGRALGETMAVIMVAGNSTIIPMLSWKGLFAPVRTLTGNIAIEMGYAAPEHQQALFATGIVLFVFIIILNTITTLLVKRGFKY
jgi:phosphate transport system permease protein